MRKTPEHLLLCLVKRAPQRLAQIRVEGDELAVLPCVLHGAVCRGAGWLAGQRQCAKVEHARLVEQGQLQLVKAELGICAGLAGKGKFAVAVCIQRHERKRREKIVRGDDALRLDPDLTQRACEELSERVRADLAEHCGLAAEFCNGGEEVRRRAAGVRRHRGISVRIGADRCKIDQKLAERNNIIHIHSSVIVIVHVFLCGKGRAGCGHCIDKRIIAHFSRGLVILCHGFEKTCPVSINCETWRTEGNVVYCYRL